MTETQITPLLETGFYRLVKGRHGRFLTNPRDTFIGRAVATYGEYSELEFTLLAQLVGEGAVAIEVGANMGALTVPLAKHLGPRGLLYALEPQPLVFQQLAANLALNDLVNVAAMNMAAGSEAERIGIARVNPGADLNFGGVALDQVRDEDQPFSVEVVRLDEAIDPSALSLIKIDVEGMESAVIEGAGGLISRFRPILYLECAEEGSDTLIAQILALGYKAWWHTPPLYNPDNYAGLAENLFPRLVSINMLCLPEESGREVAGLHAVTGPGDHPKRR
ncbi:MAG: FkbM family methyltransferase [Pseudomonadota bacterium]